MVSCEGVSVYVVIVLRLVKTRHAPPEEAEMKCMSKTRVHFELLAANYATLACPRPRKEKFKRKQGGVKVRPWG